MTEAHKDDRNHAPSGPAVSPVRPAFCLSQQQRRKLLKLARRAISEFLEAGTFSIGTIEDEQLGRKAGAFVTLRRRGNPNDPAKSGLLRGCIGRIEDDKPLVEVVQAMAVKAATRDPRFEPVSRDELSGLVVEISILSCLEAVGRISEVELGVHGLVFEGGAHRAVLLPKVPLARGWDRREFLEGLLHKARVTANRLPDGSMLYKFTTLELSDAEMSTGEFDAK